MNEKNKETKQKKENKIKSFFKSVVGKIDKKMEEKSKNPGSCCGISDKSKGGRDSCCS